MPRLFVAVEMPPDVREGLANVCHGVPSARWSGIEQMHLTLHFIGAVADARFDDIVAALEEVEAEPFSVRIEGAGWFPPRGEPRVLWAGIAPCPPLMRLQHTVEAALAAIGLEGDGRAFHPHITLARLGDRAALRPVTDFVAAHSMLSSRPVEVDTFHLFSSELRREGALHTRETSFPLAAPER